MHRENEKHFIKTIIIMNTNNNNKWKDIFLHAIFIIFDITILQESNVYASQITSAMKR